MNYHHLKFSLIGTSYFVIWLVKSRNDLIIFIFWLALSRIIITWNFVNRNKLFRDLTGQIKNWLDDIHILTSSIMNYHHLKFSSTGTSYFVIWLVKSRNDLTIFIFWLALSRIIITWNFRQQEQVISWSDWSNQVMTWRFLHND